MTEEVLYQRFQKIIPIKVMGVRFAYNEITAAHAEVDSRTWTLLCRNKTGNSRYRDRLKSISRLKPLLKSRHPIQYNSREHDLKNIILQISHSCNLRCKYCSADFGRYGRDFRMMSYDMAKRAIDFLYETTKSDHLSITYFGGEPFLNLDTVLRSACYSLGRATTTGKMVSLHLVTNGVMLDLNSLRTLDDLGFSLTVSLDGPPKHHNDHRPFASGKGSYKFIAKSLRAAADLPIRDRITIRGTFARSGSYFFPNVKFVIEEGFSRNISYEPVFLPSTHPLAIRWKDIPKIKQAYTDLAKYYVRRIRQNRAFCLWDFDDAIIQLLLNKPRQARCGSGVATVSITAEGDIYGCHMSTGIIDTWIGCLDKGIVDERKSAWENIYLNGRSGCSECWLRALCGGGCNSHAIFYNRSLSKPYRLECELIEWRYRLALWIIVQCPELRSAFLSSRHFQDYSARDSGHVLVAPLWYHLANYRHSGKGNEKRFY